jgi:DNA anti-recombination protein RmuC
MNFEERMERIAERHEALAHTVELLAADQRATGRTLRRAIALAVREERNERRRRREMDTRLQQQITANAERSAQLEAAQARLFAKIDAFIESMRHGNGRP